jgi:hypothetical protein
LPCTSQDGEYDEASPRVDANHPSMPAAANRSGAVHRVVRGTSLMAVDEPLMDDDLACSLARLRTSLSGFRQRS